jgi:hypothetical protein
MEEKIAHLEFIQQVIKRMSTNSFLIKGWSVALVSAILAVAATNKDLEPLLVLIAYFPASVLWILDGYYLYQERLFKKLYDDVRTPNTAVGDFSMDVSKYRDNTQTWRKATFSRTLLIFHGCILMAILIVTIGLFLFR